MIRARFAYPGDLQTPTGGYGYARRLIDAAPGAGLALEPLALPAGFPNASAAQIDMAGQALGVVPGSQPIVLDGLAGGVLPGRLLESLSAPVIMLCHHPLAFETGLEPGRAERLAHSERAALAACAHVITTSHTTAVTLGARFGVPPHRITVAPPGTDTAPVAPGSGEDQTRILSVGSLSPRKGHHLLIEALSALRDRAWHLGIAGAALDRRYAEGLAVQIDENGLSDRITLMGPLSHDQLAREYNRADLFVLASQFEGFGMAFTEAMARGLPVLGCPVGAVPEATLGAARLVAPRDLGPALARLLDDPAALSALGAACERASHSFIRWRDTAAIAAQVVTGVLR
ncbi:MAG: glycosyltransferase family 4 protein [Pseudomonadota bacterium]